MPKDISKMFAKRLSEAAYKQLKSFLDGKVTFNQVGTEAQKVLSAITKPENERSFDDQEKLYEMKIKLIIDKYITGSDVFDQIEVAYRTFMLGHAARRKFFKMAGGTFVEDEAILRQKWDARVQDSFQKDKKLGKLAQFTDRSPEQLKQDYRDEWFEWLTDPENKMPLAKEYRSDFPKEEPGDIELQKIESGLWSKADIKESRVSGGGFRDADGDIKKVESNLWDKADIKESRVSGGGFRSAETEMPKMFGRKLNQFLTESKEWSFGSRGLTVNAEKFKNWLLSGAEDIAENIGLVSANLAVGVGVTELVSWIGKMSGLDSHGQEVLNFTVTEAMAGIQLLLASGPVGIAVGAVVLAALPVMKLIGYLKGHSAERRKANDTPEKVYGTQFARVRSEDQFGTPTWYIGILASKDLWTGIGSKEQNIRINYGKLEDLHWRLNKDSTFSPYFDHPRYRMINAHDDDLGRNASEQMRAKNDPFRDFSLFTLKETDNMFSNLVRGKDLSAFKEKPDDRSKLSNYMQELLSYRDDMEFIRDFNTGGEEIGRNLNPADREIRREYQHSLLAHTPGAKTLQSREIQQMMERDMNDNTKLKGGYAKYKDYLGENKVLLKYFRTRVEDLLRSQRVAAQQSPGFLHAVKDIEFKSKQFNSLLYNLDTGTKPARSLDELKAQLKKNEESDLTWYQKSYIQQKNIVRYVGQKLSQRDLGRDIAFQAVNPWQDTYDMGSPGSTALHYNGVVSAMGSMRIFNPEYKVTGKDRFDFGNPQAPWSNSDESVVPTWLYDGKILGSIAGIKGSKLDYIKIADERKTFLQLNVLAPTLRKPSKFKPSKIWQQSNMFTDMDWVIAQHGKLIARQDPETADEKRARLATDKEQIQDFGRTKDGKPYIPDGTGIKPRDWNQTPPSDADPTDRQDKWYKHDPSTAWDMMKHRWVKNKYKKSTQKKVSQKDRKTTSTFVEVERLKKQREQERIAREQKEKTSTFLEVERLKKQREQERIAREQKLARDKQRELDWTQRHSGTIHGMTPKQWAEYQANLEKERIAKRELDWTKQKQWESRAHLAIEHQKGKTTVIPKQPLPQQVKSVHVSALQEYLRDQHGMNVSAKSINEKTLPFLAFDEKGRPALYGDPILHKKMGLPDAYRVVTGPTGFIHKSYDPSLVQPKFFNEHETSVVQQY